MSICHIALKSHQYYPNSLLVLQDYCFSTSSVKLLPSFFSPSVVSFLCCSVWIFASPTCAQILRWLTALQFCRFSTYFFCLRGQKQKSWYRFQQQQQQQPMTHPKKAVRTAALHYRSQCRCRNSQKRHHHHRRHHRHHHRRSWILILSPHPQF